MAYLLILFLFLTVGVLIVGLVGFSRNSESYQRNANKLMRYRILFQFLALVVAMAIIAMAAGGK